MGSFDIQNTLKTQYSSTKPLRKKSK